VLDAISEKRDGATTPTAPKPLSELTVAELAERLQPVRLVGEYEYRLAQPDYLVAERILASINSPPPPTSSYFPSVELGAAGEIGTQWVIGTDERYQTANAANYTGSASGHLTQNCSFAMIGPSTALSAAHCFYINGSWISGGLTALGANNFGPSAGNNTTPFGTFYADSLTLPGAWISGRGALNGGAGETPSSHAGWDDDYAVLEFSPTQYPGYTTGWYGARQTYSGLHYIMGYPTDKLYRAQWSGYGYMTWSVGSRYTHDVDIIPGMSGACSREYGLGYWSCTGIQSTHWNDGSTLWNEVRRWDSTTYNFFDAYGNWP
jgi:V8-like Glu-specific endopeptidase